MKPALLGLPDGPATLCLPPGLGWSSYRLGQVRFELGPDTPVIVADDELLIVGSLRDRAGAPVRDMDMDRRRAIIDSDGDALVRTFWGRYVALWRDRRDGGVRAMRDPSGAVPLYLWRDRGRFLLFSDPDEIVRHHPVPLRVEWEALAHRLLYPHLPTRRSCWTGVREILAGEAVALDAKRPDRLVWSPWAWAGRDEGSGTEERVRSAVALAVRSLASDAAPVLLELSGGLDSSIVAACLAEAGVDWSASTIVPPGADGDERAYARAVTHRFGAALAETSLTPDAVDLTRPPTRLRPNPGGYGMIDAIDRAQAAAADAAGACSLMSGTGGDNVFCSLRSAAPVLDAVRAAGLGQGWRTARGLAQLTGTPLSSVFRSALRYAVADRRRPNRWRSAPLFLDPSCRPALMIHPWLDAPPGRPPGARAHVVMLLRAALVLDGLDRARTHTMLFPLLSQPVMEACLSVPSWRWVSGAGDRAVARRAFADVLPPTVLARRGKGRLESLLVPAYDRDRPRLRELLLDGRLARAGLLDREALARALDRPARVDDAVYTRIMQLADAELWAGAVASVAGEEARPACGPSGLVRGGGGHLVQP